MHLLVVVEAEVSADLLRHVADGLAPDAEVLVIAPATTRTALRFWVSDVDRAIERAEHAEERTVDHLEEAGIDAHGAVGDSEPLVAIQDALVRFPADRIVLIGHEAGHRDYREDGDLALEVRERFGLPVDFGTVAG